MHLKRKINKGHHEEKVIVTQELRMGLIGILNSNILDTIQCQVNEVKQKNMWILST